MEKFSFFPFFFFFFFFVSSSAVAGNIRAIFTFGDSIFDAGNNHFNPNCSIQADFPPYGRNFFHHPTGRFTNGRTITDFVSELLGVELQKPYLEVQLEIAKGILNKYPVNGINFASAGSGVLNDTNANFGVITITTQLQQFEALVKQKEINKKTIDRAFFFFESGSNDVFQYYLFSESEMDAKTYVGAMVEEAKNWLVHIYRLGARRISVFGLGPIGCIPARMLCTNASVDTCHEEMNQMAQRYNSGLERLARKMAKEFPGLHITYAATYDTVMLLRALPQRYAERRWRKYFYPTTSNSESDSSTMALVEKGYRHDLVTPTSRAHAVVTGLLRGMGQCGVGEYTVCDRPDEFLFWDFFHPTEHTYSLLTKAFWTGNQKKIRPLNLQTLANTTL